MVVFSILKTYFCVKITYPLRSPSILRNANSLHFVSDEHTNISRRSILSASQRATFERLPTDAEELARHYSLTEDDLVLIRKCRGAHNRLGFAIQLCLMRYPGRVLRIEESIPDQLLAFVAEQVERDRKSTRLNSSHSSVSRMPSSA